MTAENLTPEPPMSADDADPADSTRGRILAYLDSLDLRDTSDMRAYCAGHRAIVRLAWSSSRDQEPSHVLTAAEATCVLEFMSCSEPIEPSTWWKDPEDAPSHVVGFCFVLDALRASIQAQAERS